MRNHRRFTRRASYARRLTLLASLCISTALLLGVPFGRDGSEGATTPAVLAAPSGLVAAYGFNEASGTTAGDASGSGNHGTVAGATWAAQGKTGGALDFDGVSGTVTVPNSASLALTTGLTLEAWVNPSDTGRWRTVMMKEQATDLAYALYSDTDGDRPAAYISVGGQHVLSGGSQVSANRWAHLALTYDNVQMRLYLNGGQVNTSQLSGGVTASTGPLRIGGNGVWGEYFRGRIDEVRIYNRPLTTAEIQSDMSAPVGNAPAGSVPGASAPVAGAPAAGAPAAGTPAPIPVPAGAAFPSIATPTPIPAPAGSAFPFNAASPSPAAPVASGATIAVDTPSNGSTVQPGFTIGGWAVDRSAPDGTGVDQVQIWAYPNPGSGQAPILLGPTNYGVERPDVAKALGSPRFSFSGFGLVTSGLTAGNYQIIVSVHSIVSGQLTSVPPIAITLSGDTATTGFSATSSRITGRTGPGTRVEVGNGIADASARQVIRTSDDRVYIVAAEDVQTLTNGGVIRVWKGSEPGVPSSFAEMDADHGPDSDANSPKGSLGAVALNNVDARLDRANVIQIVYVDNSTFTYPTRRLLYTTFFTSTDTWGPTEVVDPNVDESRRGDLKVSLSLDANDQPQIVYAAGGNSLKFTARTGATWSVPTSIDETGSATHPMTALDSTGALHVTWLRTTGSPQVLYRSRSATGQWGPLEVVAGIDVRDNSSLDQGPSLALTSTDVPYVLYLNNSYYLRLRYQDPSGAWQLDNLPTTIFAHTPQIYIRAGDLYLFLGHDSQIFYSYVVKRAGQGWTSPTVLNNLEQTDGSASVRWDPLRETNPNVIDSVFFSENEPLLFYIAVTP